MNKLFKNPAGYVGARDEMELHRWIIEGQVRIPGLELKKHHPNFQRQKAIPDFLFADKETGRDIYMEVKPWFLRISDIQQIVKYWIILRERHEEADLGVLCGGVSEERRELLRRLGIRIYLLKDVISSLIFFLFGGSESGEQHIENERESD